MIRSFRHKGLKALFLKGKPSGVKADLQGRTLRRLDVLNQAERLKDLDVPGFDFHALQGKPRRYTVHVNGPWCITFEWEDGDVLRVDLEQYH